MSKKILLSLKRQCDANNLVQQSLSGAGHDGQELVSESISCPYRRGTAQHRISEFKQDEEAMLMPAAWHGILKLSEVRRAVAGPRWHTVLETKPIWTQFSKVGIPKQWGKARLG